MSPVGGEKAKGGFNLGRGRATPSERAEERSGARGSKVIRGHVGRIRSARRRAGHVIGSRDPQHSRRSLISPNRAAETGSQDVWWRAMEPSTPTALSPGGPRARERGRRLQNTNAPPGVPDILCNTDARPLDNEVGRGFGTAV